VKDQSDGVVFDSVTLAAFAALGEIEQSGEFRLEGDRSSAHNSPRIIAGPVSAPFWSPCLQIEVRLGPSSTQKASRRRRSATSFRAMQINRYPTQFGWTAQWSECGRKRSVLRNPPPLGAGEHSLSDRRSAGPISCRFFANSAFVRSLSLCSYTEARSLKIRTAGFGPEAAT